ncbi:hypothetical protein [Mycobacterium marinum]|uniref:hypothetical protein n=1 Tax=Mycobacterium marinum TaxID=1781 RepID=UPI002358ADE9|nr:hypothetical protein [Mycobacterium marinum]MDC8973170.1 hypothetical protein [Mycobacterium marinum]
MSVEDVAIPPELARLSLNEWFRYLSLRVRRGRLFEFATDLAVSSKQSARSTLARLLLPALIHIVVHCATEHAGAQSGEQPDLEQASDQQDVQTTPDTAATDQRPEQPVDDSLPTEVTKFGIPIFDRRYRLKEEAADESANVTDEDAKVTDENAKFVDSNSQSVDPSDGHENRRCQFFCGLLIKVVKLLTSSPVQAVDDTILLNAILRKPASRAVILGSSDSLLEPVIELAVDTSLGDWREAVHHWLLRNADVKELASIVSRDLLVADFAGSDERSTVVLLKTIRHVASALPEDTAQQLLLNILGFAAADIDPYEENSLHIVARDAVVVLLRQRPELLGSALQAIRASDVASSGVPEINRDTAARLVAVSLRERGRQAAGELAEIAIASDSDIKKFQSLSRLADAPLLNQADKIDHNGLRKYALILWREVVAVPTWGLILAVIIAVGLITYRVEVRLQPINVTLQIAIATIAVLATTHVFAVNFSASRLPGTIGRYVSRARTLTATYTASVALIALSIWLPTTQPVKRSHDWMSTAAVVIWAVSLVSTLLTVLSRSDSARAAAGFASWQLPRARTCGKQVGYCQAHTLQLNAIANSVPNLEMKLNGWRDSWDKVIKSRRRGIFLPSYRGIRNILSHSEFGAGARLRFVAGFGLIAGQRQDIAHLVPTRSQALSHRIISSTQRNLRVLDSSDIEELSSGVVALTKLSADLAFSGDTGTAHAVAHSLTRLVSAHLSSVRHSRRQELTRWRLREQARQVAIPDQPMDVAAPEYQAAARSAREDDDPAPVSPVVRDAVNSAIQHAIDRPSSLFSIAESIVKPILESSGTADMTMALVAGPLSDPQISSAKQLNAVLDLLAVAGHRAIELRSDTAMSLILRDLSNLAVNTEFRWRAIETIVLLVAYASRYDVRLAHQCCDALGEQLRQVSEIPAARALWRAGSAAIAAGAVSIAVRAAQIAVQLDAQQQLIGISSMADCITTESSLSDFFGAYLGSSPRDSLEYFAKFFEKAQPLLAGKESQSTRGQ